MQNCSFSPTSWIKVGLAILPGLFIVGTRSGLFRRWSPRSCRAGEAKAVEWQ